MEKVKRFEIGKAYQHNSGKQMFICGMADTIFHGKCFIAETGWHKDKLRLRMIEIEEDRKNGCKTPDNINRKELVPVSMADDWASVNWFEIDKSVFIENNTCK